MQCLSWLVCADTTRLHKSKALRAAAATAARGNIPRGDAALPNARLREVLFLEQTWASFWYDDQKYYPERLFDTPPRLRRR